MKEREVQNIAREKLEKDGYVYWFPPRTWGERDIMTVFDVIAAKDKKVLLIQLTTIQHLSDRVKKIRSFYQLNKVGPFPNVFVWAYNPKKSIFKISRVL